MFLYKILHAEKSKVDVRINLEISAVNPKVPR